ncbi:hypothetical protein CBR_g44308 [Chara braunii]|uniref:Myb-like domain-containing protein n=1 Tax=Chara braunii TaxID=69332 RepID=A0A388K3B1_CHABU|nr:hypothetical protein CBR_g44308 [Chara braunii]|eukprot:GBG64423.1 hypothetical protein CBR_g44308 [Chara braunii]
MERRESSAGQHRRGIEFSIHERPLSGHRPPAYDRTLYSHLPPHQQPLPPDPEEEWLDDLSHTLPLGSGSTQEWMGRHYQQREAGTSRQSYSAMLDGGDTEIVDLDFGLSSRTPGVGANTCASNHVGATTIGQTYVGRVGVAGVGGRSSRVGGTADGCRQAPSICGGVGPARDPPRAVLPTHSATPSPALWQRAAAPAANTSTSPPKEMGRQAWASCRQQMRRATADNITNEVSRMRVGSDADADEESPDSHCEEEPEDADDLEIRPIGGSVGEKGGKHPAWSVEEMIKLARAKRDRHAHFEGMPHNYGRTRNREWKLQDLQKRLVDVGVKRTTDDIGKKWDNLFHHYKKVQRYQNTSRGKNFFILTSALRTEEGFNFRMDQRVYLGIDNMPQGNKTIYHDILTDTKRSVAHGATWTIPIQKARGRIRRRQWQANRKGARLEVQKLCGVHGSEGEMEGEGGQDVSPMDVPSTVTPTLGFRRDGVSRERMIALANLGLPGTPRGGGSGTVHSQGIVINDTTQQRPISSTSTIVFVVERTDKGQVPVSPLRHMDPLNTLIIGGSSRVVAPSAQARSPSVHATATAAGERQEDRTVEEAGRKEERRDEIPRPDCGDDNSLNLRKKRTRQEEELEAKSKLWVDGKTFWGRGPGCMIADVVHDCANYYCAIVNGDAGATAPHGVIMPGPDVLCVRIEDPAQREPALRRARRTENVTMRVIHGWIFRSSSRSDGFARAESYVAVHYPTDLAKAPGSGPTTGKCPSQDLAESQTLSARCLLLASCMWVMRMGGDDARSYEEASYYAQLVAKPTIVAAGSQSFNWRRHVLQSANAVLTRLGKPPLTMGAFPNYISEWASCGVRFNYHAGLADLDIAAKMDWMGAGPFDGDHKEDGPDDDVGK